MPNQPRPTSVEQGSALSRMWHKLFGPRFRPDVLRQTEDKKRTEAEGMIRLGDEGPIADETIEAVDKLPDHRRSRKTRQPTRKV